MWTCPEEEKEEETSTWMLLRVLSLPVPSASPWGGGEGGLGEVRGVTKQKGFPPSLPGLSWAWLPGKDTSGFGCRLAT